MNNKYIIIILIIIFSLSINSSVLANQEDLYSGKKFRNPFIEFKDPTEQIKPDQDIGKSPKQLQKNKIDNNSKPKNTNNVRKNIETLKKEVPFSLDGIIQSKNNKVALLNTGTKVEIVSSNYEYKGYRVTVFEKDSIIVENNGFKFRVTIGGEIDEI